MQTVYSSIYRAGRLQRNNNGRIFVLRGAFATRA